MSGGLVAKLEWGVVVFTKVAEKLLGEEEV